MELHERMKELQTDSDIKIRTLAPICGVSEQVMGTYLNGKHAVPKDVLIRFAQYFHVTTDYLLGLTDDPQRPFPVSREERELLEVLRTLDREQRELVWKTVALLREQNGRAGKS